MVMSIELTLKSGFKASHGESKMSKKGSTSLTIWNGITLLPGFLKLSCVVIFKSTSPLLVMVHEKSGIASQTWAFRALLFVIGFMEDMAFITTLYNGNGDWRVEVVRSFQQLIGIGLSGVSNFKGRKNEFTL